MHGAIHRLISNSMQARSARPSMSMSHGQWKRLRMTLSVSERSAGRRIGARNTARRLFERAGQMERRGNGCFDRQPEIGILFVVAQDDIKARAVALDQIAFEDQRFQLETGDDGFEVGDFADQQAGLGGW